MVDDGDLCEVVNDGRHHEKEVVNDGDHHEVDEVKDEVKHELDDEYDGHDDSHEAYFA